VDLNRYRFRSRWRLPAPVDDVFDALGSVRDYPAWWPEVREVARVDEETARVRCRSLLPYDLVFTMREERRDPAAGVLETSLAGDLDGFSRFTLRAEGAGTVADYAQEVVASKPLLRRTALLARPVFVANHRLMMRNGERGLRTFLAGLRLGRELET
jgi:hypothetical protein